ncbi:tripartite tricarboxylate transporter TctB family protein [Rhodoferax sp. 4810]|nr:tripartite tricarboxylate transporter TctB family protein [Rhodoferax jenense]
MTQDTQNGTETAEQPVVEAPPPKGEYKMLVLLMVICGALFYDSLRSPGLAQGVSSGPGSIPQLVAGALVLMVIVLAIQCFRRGYKEGTWAEAVHYLFDKEVVVLLSTIAVYGLVIETIHFVPATFLFLVATMYLLERKHLLLKIAISAGTVGVLYLIFSTLFQVVLP